MALTDDELMERLAAGHADAMTELYARYQRPLVTYLARLVRDRHAAEDLLQETFLRVYRSRHAYQGSGQLRAWLFTIARHVLIDRARRDRLVWDQLSPSEESVAAPERAEHRAEARDLLARLERALGQLPRDQREVVVLARFAGLGPEEIARVTGTTAGNVRVRLHRALRHLAVLIGE